MAAISCIDVSFAYDQSHTVLRDLSFDITEKSLFGITGLNGSGKTTLSLCFNGSIPHLISGKLIGEVSVFGESVKKHPVSYFARKVGMVFQNPDFALFNLTVHDEILFGLNNLKLPDQEERIIKAAETVGILEFLQRDPHSLSYGQKQKVNLACVLAMDTEMIVLDEPSAMLDYRSSVQLYDLLQKLNHQGKTIIVIEHDTDLLAGYTQNMLILEKGKMVEYGETKSVLSETNRLKQLGLKIPAL